MLRKGETPSGPAVYWMGRDQRIEDNRAFKTLEQHRGDRGNPAAEA